MSNLIQIINDLDGQTSRIMARLAAGGKRGKCILCIGSTATSDVDGISLAGMTPAARRLVPAVDAELVICGRPLSLSQMPNLPHKAVSPAVILRACAQLLQLDVEVVNCGVCQPPMVPYTNVGNKVANSVSSGQALPLNEVEALFLKGCEFGRNLHSQFDYVLIAEVVPAGTTTALGLFTAFGYDVSGLVSSSIPSNNHKLREELVLQGLAKANLNIEKIRSNPFIAVAAVGDPMQPFAAGIAATVSKHIPVVLGGGSQMLAVYKLIELVKEKDQASNNSLEMIVATTKWVAFDPWADTRGLSVLLNCPLLCSLLDFTYSKNEALKLYEQGNVKEGVGAGAAMVLANLVGGFSASDILAKIDEVCLELFSK